MMADTYLAISRKFRPQRFADVLGQERTVISLQNALHFGRIAHAYLFSGTRGCGKTTLARLFAKALNCTNRGKGSEPCGTCDSCRAIGRSTGLDVVEIDGASHRGIDDIRQLRDSAGYSASGGGFKIYIIDEVHMLTKEAFNALLKTLEEPPPQIKFFLATTELHRVPLTIQSRCQRFALERVAAEKIEAKLVKILTECAVPFEKEAVALIAGRAEGSVRDAESILDQVICFAAENLQLKQVRRLLGAIDPNWYFELDEAVRNGALQYAFSLSERLIEAGIDLHALMEGLREHFRNHLLACILCTKSEWGKKPDASPLAVPHGYAGHSAAYTQEHCLNILEVISRHQQIIKSSSHNRVHLEMLLVDIIRSASHISWQELWGKLQNVEALLRDQNPQITRGVSTLQGEKSFSTHTSPPHHVVSAKPPPAKPKSAEPSLPPQEISEVQNAVEPRQIHDETPATAKETVGEMPPNASLSRQRGDTLVQFTAVEFGAKIEIKTHEA